MNPNNENALCRKCRQWKPKALFTRYTSGRLRPQCPDCLVLKKDAQKARYAKLQSKRADLLLNGKTDCTQCGQIKTLDEFVMNGKTHMCKACVRKNARRHYQSQSIEQRRIARRSTWRNMMEDPETKLRYALRKRMTTALHQALAVKSESSAGVLNYIGCSITQLRQYLEGQFKPGMNWGNHGIHGWHIDHVLPLSSFDVTNAKELRRAWHYTNLRPLWAKENLRKHAINPKQHQGKLLLAVDK